MIRAGSRLIVENGNERIERAEGAVVRSILKWLTTDRMARSQIP